MLDMKEEESSEMKTAPAPTSAGKRPGQAVVVLGEASESDDDDDDEIFTDNSAAAARVILNNRLQASMVSSHTVRSRPARQYTHNSLLHRKLREKNTALRDHIIHDVKQPYKSTTVDLNTMTQFLVKSQSVVQDVITILRQVTNDVFHLEDKLDISIDCARLVPDINIRIPARMPVE